MQPLPLQVQHSQATKRSINYIYTIKDNDEPATGDVLEFFLEANATKLSQRVTEVSQAEKITCTNPYKKGDKVTHNGFTWISTVDNNVWEPGVYGWEKTA